MNAHQITTDQNCLNGAYDKTMSFPAIVGTLMQAGFESYIVDYRRNTSTYFLPNCDHIVLENLPSEGPVASHFDKDGIVSQIKWAQSNSPDYTNAAFSK